MYPSTSYEQISPSIKHAAVYEALIGVTHKFSHFSTKVTTLPIPVKQQFLVVPENACFIALPLEKKNTAVQKCVPGLPV